MASKTEDTFGVVQSTGSISASLDSLVACLLAVERQLLGSAGPEIDGGHLSRPPAHAVQIGQFLLPLAKSTRAYGRLRFDMSSAISLQPISLSPPPPRRKTPPISIIALLTVFALSALNTAIYNVLTSFYEFMGSFPVSPAVAYKLQSFQHFNE